MSAPTPTRETVAPLGAPEAHLAKEALRQVADRIGRDLGIPAAEIFGDRHVSSIPAQDARLIFIYVAMSIGGARSRQMIELLAFTRDRLERHTLLLAQLYAKDEAFAARLDRVAKSILEDAAFKRRLSHAIGAHFSATMVRP